MLLTESEVQESLEQARTAFPKFDNWEYNNEKNAEYMGFSLWGEFDVVDDERPDAEHGRHEDISSRSIRIRRIGGAI